MIKLKIDNIEVSVKENTSALKAAESVGIEIPTMCFMEGFTNHPSCMVCMVKDKNTGSLFPSCAIAVTEGMEIITDDDEVIESRKDSLELLMSDHVGDCEAPCRVGCPAFLNIPLMNRLIATKDFKGANKVAREELALPIILGYICQAPCEKVCRRAPIDNPVAICQLEKYVAIEDLKNDKPYFPPKSGNFKKNVAIIGAGPAGLSCAFYLTMKGYNSVVFDKNSVAGGSLQHLPEDVLPKKVLEEEIEFLWKYGVEFKFDKQISSTDIKSNLLQEFDAVVIATGSSENFNIDDSGLEINKDLYTSNIEKVFACGSVIKKQEMAVRAISQGKACANSVDQYLQGKSVEKISRIFNSKFGKLKPEEFEEYLLESTTIDRVNPILGNLKGFSIEEAVKEAERCMHCDCRKPVTCKLRIYAEQYSVDRRKYLSGDRKIIRKYFNHESIVFEPEKCIKCGLCVEITTNEKELIGLTYVGRGFDVKIDVPFNRTIGDAMTKTAVKCAEFCPTAAISLKNNRD